MSIFGWIILGGLAGWVASKFTGNDARMGVGMNILVGIIGALIGGWIVSMFGGVGISGFNIWSFIIALLGAIVLLTTINAFSSNQKRFKRNT